MAPEQQQGRQSPDPQRQGKAQTAPPAEHPNMGQENDQATKDNNKKTLEGLQSNPEHILAKAAEEKTSKQ